MERSSLGDRWAFGLHRPHWIHRRKGSVIAALVATLMALGVTSALADNVQNDVVVGGNDTIQLPATSTTVNFQITANSGDLQAGCNAADGSSASVSMNAPAGVTATPSSLTFTSCSTSQSVVFSSSTVGNHVIEPTVLDSGPGTYNVNPAKFTLKVLAAPVVSDTTAPVISYTLNPSAPDGINGWYVTNVGVDWTVTDGESAISSSTGCDDATLSTDTTGTTFTCSATSAGGTNSVTTVTIKRDATPPTVTCATPAPSFLLNQAPANVTATVSDGTSGPVSSSVSAAADTSSVGGDKSVTLNGADIAGNTNSASCSYSVTFGFTGFFSPVDNPTVMNAAKAGQAIPLKWRLVDANDVPVTNLSSASLTVASLTCAAGTTTDAVEEYAAGSSGLQNLGDGYYQFNWKTPTSYASSCKTLRLDLGEGSPHTALFQFKK
jgi:hypothetical protein